MSSISGPPVKPEFGAGAVTGASWNHHRTAAVSEGPAAASADAQSRRMIPKTRGLAVPLRLVLRTQPRFVSARFWWWFQDAPARHKALTYYCSPPQSGL